MSSTSLLPTPAPVSATSDDGVPPELHCKICSKVMADAAVASRCCFGSFCDACIRSRIAAASTCACGAASRADDLIPNLTLRATIAKLLATRAAGSGSGGADNRKSSTGSNAAEPTPPPRTAASQASSSSSQVTATACSERTDGSASSTSRSAAAPAAREPRTTKQTAAAAGIGEPAAGYIPEQYGYGNPFGPPACYDPFFGATPWTCDPYMYYGAPYGGGYYTDVPAAAGYHDGYHGRRKRTADEEYNRHAEADGFKRRRCRGGSEVAF